MQCEEARRKQIVTLSHDRRCARPRDPCAFTSAPYNDSILVDSGVNWF